MFKRSQEVKAIALGVVLLIFLIIGGVGLVVSASESGKVSLPAWFDLSSHQAHLEKQQLGEMEVSIVWTYIDLDRASIEYTLSGISVPHDLAPQFPACPVRSVNLSDRLGREYGVQGLHLECSRISEDSYVAVQSFYHDWPLEIGDEVQFVFAVVIDESVISFADGSVMDVVDFVGGGEVASPFENALQQGSLPDSKSQIFTFQFDSPVQEKLIPRSTQATYMDKTATLERVEMNRLFSTATVCLDLPNNADWLPEASLDQGGNDMAANGWELIDGKKPETTASSHRCYRFYFPFGIKDRDKRQSLSLRIDHLVTSLPEVLDKEACEQANKKVLQGDLRMGLKCVSQDGMIIPKLTNRPEGMEEEEAQEVLMNAFVQTFDSSWAFQLE